MNILNKIIKFGLYFALLLPLIFTSRTMYPWHFGKTVLFQILVEILLFLAIIYFSLNKEKKLPKLTKLDYLILAFPLLQIISAILGVNFNRSFWGEESRAQGIFTWVNFTIYYFLLRTFLSEKRDWLKYGLAAITISLISSFAAIFVPHLNIFENIIGKSYRISGLIGNPIFFASYLIIPLLITFALLAITKEKKWKILLLIAALFNLSGFLLAQTRGAFLGLIAGVLLSVFLYLLFSKNKKNKIITASIVLIFFIAFAGIYLFNRKSDYLKSNLPAVSQLFEINFQVTTANTRLMAWQIALKSWQDKPLFGWGPENFQDAFDKHYNPDFLKYSFAETTWDKPHSYPLEVLSTMGIVGFSVYLCIIFFAFYYLIKNAKRSSDEKNLLFFVILTGAVAAYIIQGSFAFETSNSLMLWLSLLAFIAFCREQETPIEINNSNNKLFNNKIFIIASNILLLVSLVILPLCVYKNISFYKASVALGDTRDAAEIESLYLWQKNAPKALSAKVPFLWESAVILTKDLSILDAKGLLDKKTLDSVSPQLIEIFENNIKKYPTSYLMRFWGGQLYTFLGEYSDKKYYQRSEELLKEAYNINQTRQNVGLTLAKTYLLEGKLEEGVKLLEEIQKTNMDYGEAHWFLGLALVEAGEKERGIEELEKGFAFAKNLSINNVFYLVNLYAEQKQYDKIIKIYNQLIIEYPESPKFYANLAATYAASGDKEKMLENIKIAVTLEPSLKEEAKNFLKQNGVDPNLIN
ncbi:MAG: O-antigen ligase family protein [Patescibacteria group bacterium]|nr:O-antigen ligase family protein [Patescibacteria group bacterium]